MFIKRIVYLSTLWVGVFWMCYLFSSMPRSDADSLLAAEKLFRHELDEIHTKMSEADQLQDKLDNQMEEIVKEVEQAQSKIAEAKKMSFEILKEDSQERAQMLFKEVTAKMQEIKEIQDRVQAGLSEKFVETATATKIELTKIETLASQLKAKMAQYQIPEQAEKTKTAQVVPEDKAVAQQSAQKQIEEPSISASFVNLLSTIAARTIKGAKKIGLWITGLVGGEVKKKTEIISSAGFALAHASEQVRGCGFGLYAAMPQMPVASTQKVVGLSAGVTDNSKTMGEWRMVVQSYIDMLAATTKKFDELRVSITQQYEAVEVAKANVKTYLSTISLVKNYLNSKKQQEEAVKPPYWKKITLYSVDKLLDFGASIVHVIVQAIASFYNYFLAPLVSKFSSDVRSKLQNMEEKREPQKEGHSSDKVVVPVFRQVESVKQQAGQEEEEEEEELPNPVQGNQMPQV